MNTHNMPQPNHPKVKEDLIQNDPEVRGQAQEVVKENQEVQEGIQDRVQDKAHLVHQ